MTISVWRCWVEPGIPEPLRQHPRRLRRRLGSEKQIPLARTEAHSFTTTPTTTHLLLRHSQNHSPGKHHFRNLTFSKIYLSTNLYASLSFFICHAVSWRRNFMHMNMTYRWIEKVNVEHHMFLVFLFEPLSLSYDPKCEGHPFKVKGITDINYVLMCCSFP